MAIMPYFIAHNNAFSSGESLGCKRKFVIQENKQLAVSKDDRYDEISSDDEGDNGIPSGYGFSNKKKKKSASFSSSVQKQQQQPVYFERLLAQPDQGLPDAKTGSSISRSIDASNASHHVLSNQRFVFYKVIKLIYFVHVSIVSTYATYPTLSLGPAITKKFIISY